MPQSFLSLFDSVGKNYDSTFYLTPIYGDGMGDFFGERGITLGVLG